MLSEEETKNLITEAKKARENTFNVRSAVHKIGACVLTTNGQYFPGCTIDGIISGVGVCTERAAVDHAIVHGKYQIKALCVVDEKLTYPCGVCLQYLYPLHQVTGADIDIIIADIHGNIEKSTLIALLPRGYISDSNDERLKEFAKRNS